MNDSDYEVNKGVELPSAVVYMSTYNGENYLRQQIESIINQNGVAVKLIIRDDGSKDNTVEIIEDYQKRYDNIVLLKGDNIGFGQSFLELVFCGEKNDADCYAFSDQDDIWDNDKLISALLRMKDMAKPALYFSAQRIVDKEGKCMRVEQADRVLGLTKYSASRVNLIRGCSQVWNKGFNSLLTDNRPDYSKLFVHDDWLTLIAFWKAQIIYDSCPRMSYRITGENTSGGTYDRFSRRPVFWYRKARLIVRNKRDVKSNMAIQLERVFPDVYISTAHYKSDIREKLRLIFSANYNKGLTWKWRLFSDYMIIMNKL